MKELTNDVTREDVAKLLKVGAQAMLYNLFEMKDYRDGVLQLMENHSRIETAATLFVAPYYHYCCQVYVAEGRKGLHRIFEECISPHILAPVFTLEYINSVYADNYDRYCDDE
tara:strand:- start:1639 stop:1977 length:339 start_codon:yes stop_codon:yes gene_type:complete